MRPTSENRQQVNRRLLRVLGGLVLRCVSYRLKGCRGSFQKHFADFAGPANSNMDHSLSERDRVTTYLPQFRRCVEAGAPSLMCAYSATNGRPACGDSGLLNDILRTEWGFQGCEHFAEPAFALLSYECVLWWPPKILTPCCMLRSCLNADVISDQDALLKATGLSGEDQPLGYAPFNSSHVIAAAAFIKAGLDLVSATPICGIAPIADHASTAGCRRTVITTPRFRTARRVAPIFCSTYQMPSRKS